MTSWEKVVVYFTKNQNRFPNLLPKDFLICYPKRFPICYTKRFPSMDLSMPRDPYRLTYGVSRYRPLQGEPWKFISCRRNMNLRRFVAGWWQFIYVCTLKFVRYKHATKSAPCNSICCFTFSPISESRSRSRCDEKKVSSTVTGWIVIELGMRKRKRLRLC